MRVEITEKRLRDRGYDLQAGDTITVPDDVGTAWCGHGWARDVDGTVPTGERVVNRGGVKPTGARHTGKAG